jgi:hypothetical protein
MVGSFCQSGALMGFAAAGNETVVGYGKLHTDQHGPCENRGYKHGFSGCDGQRGSQRSQQRKRDYERQQS